MNRKLISSFLTSLLTLIFFSCADLNTNVKDFFVFYTESAAVEKENTNSPYETTPGGLKCFNSEGNSSITLYLRNPQNYDLDFRYVFNSQLMNQVQCEGPSYTIVQSRTDKSKVTLTFNENFLKAVDMGQVKNDEQKIIKNISGTLKMNERMSQRSFDSYSIKYGADSVPPRFRNVMYQRNLGPGQEGSSYVICFNIPNLAGTVHEADTHDIYIEKDHWSINAPKISGDGDITADPSNKYSLSTIPPADLLALDGSPAVFTNPDSELYTSLYYVTDINPESTIKAVSYNVTLRDDAGLSYSTTVKNSALQLKEPEVNVSTGTYLGAEEESECYTIEFNHSRGTWKYDELLGKVDGASVASAPQVAYTILRGSEIFKTGSGTVPLKVNLPAHSDKYTIKAYAFHKSYVDSDDMTPVTNVKINRSANYYVHAETGSNEEGLGSKASPFATIQRALEAVKKNNDTTETSDIKIRLMSSLELTESVSITSTTVGTKAKFITIEPYGIRTASLSIKPGSSITSIIDSQTAAGSKITLNNLIIQSNTSKDNPLNNSIINNNTATMIMNNVTVQNSAVTCDSGLIHSNSPITINNSTIKNCYSSSMLIKASSELTITGSTITGNKAKYIVYNNGNMKLIDSAVSDNTIINGDSNIGAILTMAQKTTTLGGKVIIKNNKTSEGVQRNFTYNNESNSPTIQIDSPLTGSDIHISYVGTTPLGYGKSLTFTSGYSKNLKANPGTIFTSDDGNVIGWNDDETEAALYSSADKPNIQVVGDIKSLKEQLEKHINDSKYTMDSSTFEALSSDISDKTLFNIESLNVSIDGGDKDRRGKIDLKSVQGRAFTISGNCNVKISNIDFTSNHDGYTYDSAYYGKYHGTGILVKSGAVVTIENCTFEKLSVDINRWNDSGNTGFAGIIEVEGGGKVIIKNCIIKNSRLLSNGSWGGAVCIQEGGKAEISYTTIEEIRGGHAGGALMVLGECKMQNCIISSNTSGDGAGIYLYNDAKSASEAHLLAENCTIKSNGARESRKDRFNQGGAGYIECNGTAEFIDCEIKDNSSYNGGEAFYVLRGTLKLDEKSRENISSSHDIFVKSSATYNDTTYDVDTTISNP